MVRHQRKFIEAVIEDVRDAKEVLLPVLMAETPDEPWSVASIGRLRAMREGLEPLIRDAADLILTFELPFVEEEERLASSGVTLERGMADFEVAMVDFERAFWDERFVEHQADPERWSLRERPTYDLCPEHRLDSDRVRRAIRDHRPENFEEIAPILGTSRTCAVCHVGVTRLLVQEVQRQKSGVA